MPGGFQELAELVLRPFSGLDPASLYEQYHAGIDLLLYLLVLLPTCRLALGRMFPDRHGQRLGTVVGVALAISLSVSQRTLGFSIRSLGPVAAGLIVFVVGVTIYGLLRHIGAGRTASGSAALIASYLSVRAVAPVFFDWAGQNQWAGYLHSLFALSLLIAGWRVFRATVPLGDWVPPRSARRSGRAGKNPFKRTRRRKLADWDAVRHRVRGLTLKAEKGGKNLAEDLHGTAKALQEHGDDARVRREAMRTLQRTMKTAKRLSRRIVRIRDVDQRLRRFDLAAWTALRRRYRQLTAEQQAKCQALFEKGRKEILAEGALEKLAKRAEASHAELIAQVERAQEALKNEEVADAVASLKGAVEAEGRVQTVLADMESIEGALAELLEQQIAVIENGPTT